MEWTDTALVLHVGKFKEADLWVRLLTLEQGLLTAFAFGGGKSRRRFTGCLDVLNIIRVRAGTSRNGQFLNLLEASLLEGPSRLRTDWRRQGVAANCVRFMEALGVPPDGGKASFTLMRSMLGLLENSEAVPETLPQLFRFRLASDQGYAPDLQHCALCGTVFEAPCLDSCANTVGEQADLSHHAAWFLVAEGMAVCPSCRLSGAGYGSMSLGMGAESLDVLRKVQQYYPEQWDDFNLHPDHWRQATRLIDAFVRYHLNLEWSGGRFRVCK